MWILGVRTVKTFPRCMGMPVGTVVVPDGPDIVRVRLEQEFRGCDHTLGRALAERARLRIARLRHWAFHVEMFFTVIALILIPWHLAISPLTAVGLIDRRTCFFGSVQISYQPTPG
jgi:hypothetical protein